jgi:hypothetical protein
VQVLKKKTLEKSIQTEVVAYAKSLGWRPFKRSTFAGYGRSGDPDYEFNKKRKSGIGGFTFFIEFKAPGKDSTELQARMQKELSDMNFPVMSDCDDVDAGKHFVDDLEKLWRES